MQRQFSSKHTPSRVPTNASRHISQFSVGDIIATLRTERLIACRLSCDRTWAERGRREYNDPFGRIFGLASGGARISHHGRTFELRPGWLYAIPAFTPARYQCESMDLHYLHYRSDVLYALEPFEYFGWDFVVPAPPDVRRIWNLLIHEERQPTATLTLQQDAGVRQFLALFAATRRSGSAGKPAVQRFHAVFSHVDRNLHRPIPLAELAAVVHLHPTYFSNTFTQAVGLTPTQYVCRKRIEHAQSQLLGTKLPLKEIAAQLGFSDVFYFSRSFRRIAGVAPSDYRALALSAP